MPNHPSTLVSDMSTPQSSFSELIDVEHNYINRLAARLRNTTSSSPEAIADRIEITHEIIWRLIRHDFSEDLVMRPAFERVLGPEGRDMMEHDRREHESAKKDLLPLFHVDPSDEQFMATIIRVFDELKDHMLIEGGEQIPRLEALLSREESHKMAREYELTQLLNPDLSVEVKVEANDIRPDDRVVKIEDRRGRKTYRVRRKRFESIQDYSNTDFRAFRRILDQLRTDKEHNAGRLGRKSSFLDVDYGRGRTQESDSGRRRSRSNTPLEKL